MDNKDFGTKQNQIKKELQTQRAHMEFIFQNKTSNFFPFKSNYLKNKELNSWY